MQAVLVCGGGGFIGSHLVKRLKREGCWVRSVDLKYPEYSPTEADDFMIGDLADIVTCRVAVDRRFDEVYQLAADMGGAGYIFTGEHDASGLFRVRVGPWRISAGTNVTREGSEWTGSMRHP